MLFSDQPNKTYPTSAAKVNKVFSFGMLDVLFTVGQLQLIRNQINFTLRHTASVNARNYTSTLSTLNELVFELIILYFYVHTILPAQFLYMK